MNKEIRETIVRIVEAAIREAEDKGKIEIEKVPPIHLELPSREGQGDLSTNFALQISKQAKLPPRAIAELIVTNIQADNVSSSLLDKVEVAGPGFVNFFLKQEAFYPVLSQIETQSLDYGKSNRGQGKKILIEFVSANPTGPLTVAHGRHAAVGDVLANLLQAVGYDAQREYYYNDAGRQMEMLGKSVQARYAQLLGKEVVFPEDGYHGEYIKDIAQKILEKQGKSVENPETFRQFAEDEIFAGIKEDLGKFGIKFDSWIKEGSLYDTGEVDETVEELRKKGVFYEQEGALWFRSSSFGDEKDRVVKKSDGKFTYLAPDIAYHNHKYKRGFFQLIDILGPDHHGYVDRLLAAVEALGHDKESLKIIILQLVSLYRGKEKLRMSTRAGDFVTLRQIMDEVGPDAARFFFLMRGTNSHLNFDLELAKQESPENPVYYIQYAHARICSILKVAEEKGIKINLAGDTDLSFLKEEEELRIIKKLATFPDEIDSCACSLEPQGLTLYLQDLAGCFHNFYNSFRVVDEEKSSLSSARLVLVKAVRQTLQNGLRLLGTSVPDKM